jgi:hypothetical protein
VPHLELLEQPTQVVVVVVHAILRPLLVVLAVKVLSSFAHLHLKGLRLL